MIVLSTFLENVSQREMEEEFVKQTEVVLRFELKKVFKFKSSYCNDSCFFLELFPAFRCNLFIRRKKANKKDFHFNRG